MVVDVAYADAPLASPRTSTSLERQCPTMAVRLSTRNEPISSLSEDKAPANWRGPSRDGGI